MPIETLGYIGIKASNLDDWAHFGTRFLGMQLVDRTARSLSFRMDDRKQRLVVNKAEDDAPGFYGWEVDSAAELDALAGRLENAGIPVAHGARALADERFVKDLIVFHDPAGNRLETAFGAESTTEPFKPGRAISGFRTGPLGMGHAVLHCSKIDDVLPFYVDLLGFKLSDYFTEPFAAYFFHINSRHHSLAFIETGQSGIHHLMVETCFLDDVGQAYDLAQNNPDMIATTFGRHVNDEVTSFYSWSPSKFMFEYGWGGRTIEPETWEVKVITEGPSLWGHERYWTSAELREAARDMRIKNAAIGMRRPLNVMDGNHTRAADVCPWWNATAPSRMTG